MSSLEPFLFLLLQHRTTFDFQLKALYDPIVDTRHSYAIHVVSVDHAVSASGATVVHGLHTSDVDQNVHHKHPHQIHSRPTLLVCHLSNPNMFQNPHNNVCPVMNT